MRITQPAWGGEGAVCDFCNREGVRWSYDAFDFTVAMPGFPLDYGSMGNWAACDNCADLIDSEAWSVLLERAVDRYVEMFPGANDARPTFAVSVSTIHQGFRDNRVPGAGRRAVA